MEIYGLASQAALQNKVQQSAKTSSENNFVTSLFDIARASVKADVPQVYAGVGKELDFRTKEKSIFESEWGDPRTLDDAMEDLKKAICKILEKEEK